MAEQKKHGPLFNSLRIFYQDWKMITSEELKAYVPYSITQDDYNEIVGVDSNTPTADV